MNQQEVLYRFHRVSGDSSLSQNEIALRNALIDKLRSSGLEVITDVEEGQRVLDIANEEIRGHRKKKSANDTALPEQNALSKVPVISFADTANIQQNLEKIFGTFQFIEKPQINDFVSELGRALSATHQGSSSQYVTIEAKNETVVTIRLANHNATTSKFDNVGRENAISIVISRKSNEGITNDGRAHVTEYFYSDKKLRNAGGKAMADIARSLRQTLYSGEYIDLTGLAEIQEVNPEQLREHRVYHGSGADFEAFDHNHIGEGEGVQAYGWGTYVTEVEGIGRMYAESGARHGSHITYDGENFCDVLDNEYYFDDTWRNWKRHLSSAKTADELKSFIRNLYFMPKGPGIRKRGKIFERQKKELIKDIDDGRIKVSLPRHIYTLEIPDDTGSNYLDYTKIVGADAISRVGDSLEKAGWVRSKMPNGLDKFSKDGKGDIILNERSSGADLYKELEEAFGSDKAASSFLSETGFVGVSYPAQHASGGRVDKARNYVIFNESDVSITDHIRFFRSSKGESYGFTMNGKIYIDPRIATAETPIHEYTHLWADMVRRQDPGSWQDIVSLMQDTPVWETVRMQYPELTSTDDIADEVLARFSGQHGAARLRSVMDRVMKDKGATTEFAALDAIRRVKEALKRFWEKVCSLLDIKSMNPEALADRVLSDLLGGVDLKKASVADISGIRSEVLAAVKASGIDPGKVTKEQWTSLLKGRRTALGSGTGKLFMLAKAPVGYALKAVNTVNSLTRSAGMEM
mgnify:CR=1 FL=1